MTEEQKLCLKAQGFKEDVEAHNVDVINAVDNKLDAYKIGRYDGYVAGYHEGFKECAKSRLNVTTISDCPIKDEWHLIQDNCPSADKLVRVLTYSNEEYICETELYYPSEDEIGYGHAIIYFYELNGDWVDSNDIKAWCELQPVPKELKEIE